MYNKTANIRDGSPDRRRRLQLAGMNKAVLASVAALALLGASVQAHAVALGAITVRSTLGEPLRAEIEIPQISSDEAASFQASLGSQQAFRTAGVSYNAALSGARVTLQRRANGQAYLQLVGSRAVNEPFLGVVIEASWANGRIVRDYTMLIDPPGRTATTAVIQAPPDVSTATAPPAAPAAAPTVAEQTTPSPAASPAAARPARAAAPATVPPPVVAGDGAGQVTVQRGDTASRIVSAHAAAAGVSLDQMLVAMLRANPKAFIRGNVNLVKAGAVIHLPTAEQAQAVASAEAHRTVLAQSRDFQAYRRGLAQSAQTTEVAAAGRTAGGSVQAKVEDRRAPAESPDRLTISKGGGTAGAESQVARSRQAQEQAERTAELQKNITELAKIQSDSSSGATTSTTDQAGVAPGINVPIASGTAPATAAQAASSAAAAATATETKSAEPQAATAPEPTPATTPAQPTASEAAPAEQPAAAEAAATPAPAPAPETAKPTLPPPPAVAPTPVAAPSLLDELMENPLLPVAGAGLIALLAGLGIYRSRQRKKKAGANDSEFIESRLQPDSFFASSGGQRVDTKEASTATGRSSMTYSPSQLDAAGDVDPVAEADVYLAYGRDMQAEEILKEALVTYPGRTSIHRKLAEIYAKRRDARALEMIATDAHGLTHGAGPDWQVITTLGSELDPDNALYKPGGAPAKKIASSAPRSRQFGADTEPQSAPMRTKPGEDSGAEPPLLDLNVDLGDTLQPQTASPAATATPAATAAASAIATAKAISRTEPPKVSPASASVATPTTSRPVDIDLGVDFAPPAPSPVAAAPVQDKKAGDSRMIEFDMEALSVDPDSRSGADIKTEQPDDADEDPLATKLSLAQEFHAIGDTEGARSLAKEVLAEASGSLKVRAERFMAEL